MRMSQPKRQVEPVAGRAAVERADRRCVEIVEHDRRRTAQVELAAEPGVAAPEVAEAALRTRHLGLQVEPGAERPAGAREHDAADIGVVIGAQQEFADLLEHRPRDRVHALRSVEGERRDVVHHLVAHLGSVSRRVMSFGGIVHAVET